MARNPRKYTLSPSARADLEEIWLYTFKRWSAEQADKYHDDIVRAFEALAVGSRQGRSADHIRPGYRRINSGSHFIFYRETQDGIEIIRILHPCMDIDRHL